MSIFLFGVFIPCIVESLFMFAIVTSPCTTYSSSDKGEPYLKPLCSLTGADKKPLMYNNRNVVLLKNFYLCNKLF